MSEERSSLEAEAKSQSEALEMAQRSMQAMEKEAEAQCGKYEGVIVDLRGKVGDNEENLRRSKDQVKSGVGGCCLGVMLDPFFHVLDKDSVKFINVHSLRTN